MDCCAPDADAAPLDRRTNDDELRLASRDIGGGLRQTELAIPGIHCGGCVQRIEKTLDKLPGVDAGAGQSLDQACDDPLARG